MPKKSKNKQLKTKAVNISINKEEKSKIKELNYKDTSEIKVPKAISEQIIGQEQALKIIRKSSLQRRNVLLIGYPGTGKSLLGQALAENLPASKLVDVLCLPNEQDENNPLIRVMPKGKGKELVNKLKLQNIGSYKNQNILFFILFVITIITPWWIRKQYGDILAAASLIGSMILLAAFAIFLSLNRKIGTSKVKIPKLLIDSSEQKTSPFIDATGSHAGALLGDCLHDPLQTLHNSSNIMTIKEYKNSKQAQIQKLNIKKIVDKSLINHNYEIIKNEKGYEATFLDKGELSVIGEKENKIIEVPVLSVNRYPREGDLIKLTTESGKELIVTPEHKIAVKNLLNQIKYIKADKLKSWYKVITIK